VPSASLVLSGPGCSPRRRLPGAASSRSRAVGRRGRGRHGQQPRHGVGRRCPAGGVHPSGFRRPGSGCPAVRSPVTWGRRPAGPALGRLLSTRPASSRLLSTRAVSSRLVSAPSVPDASVSSHAQAVALGTKSRWPGDRDHRTGRAPVAAGPSTARLTVEEAGTRATVPKSGWSVGGRWRTRPPGWCGPRRPRLPAARPGSQAGVRSARRGRLRGGHGSRLQREVAASAAWAVLGWVRDHAVWSLPSLTAGWADPEGPGEVPAGNGCAAPARPKPAASRTRSLLAAL
jgi:hypothetical protein